MLEGKKIVVVMPAYNAEKTLESTYNEIPKAIVDHVLVVDDHSTDETVKIAKRLGLEVFVHEKNLGYGANQKTCYKQALKKGADIIIMLHPDYQYPPKLITAMAGLICSGMFDIVLGSRILGGMALKGGMPLYKYVSNRILTFIGNIFLGQKLSEYHTGYRAFAKEVLLSLPILEDSDDFVFDNEIIAQAIYFDYRIGEITAPSSYTKESSSISFKRSIIYGFGVIWTAIRFFLQRIGVAKFSIFEQNGKKSPPKTRSNLNLLIVFLIIAGSFALLSYTLKDVKFAAGADEGFYFKYATYIGEKGVSGFQDLFKDYVQNQQNWLFPNPLRIGFIALSAIWLKITGSSLLNLAYLSLLCFYLFVFFSYCFVKKYFGQKLAILLTILLAFSPLNMAVARRALMDSASNLFMFLSIWLFFESIKENNNRKSTLFILIYSFTILIKEISVFLSAFFVFYLFLRRIAFKKPLKLKDFLAATVLPFSIAGMVYIVMAGGISWVIDTAEIILNSPQNNQYALLFGSGPWFRYLIDWMLLSPWVFILALGFCFYYIMKSEWQEEVFYLLMFSAISVFILSIFTKNIRYLIFLDMPIRLFSLLLLNELRKKFFKEKGFVVLVVLVVCICFFDYLNFYNLFIRHGIYDPVTYLLLQAQHIIPWK